MENFRTTTSVCALLGISPAALNSWLSRHEKYKPARRNRDGFLWTYQEIAAIRAARATQPTRRNTARR